MSRHELLGLCIVGVVSVGLVWSIMWFSEDYYRKHGQALHVEDRTTKILTYKNIGDIPEVIAVNGPGKIWTSKYPFFICFDPQADPKKICTDDQYFGCEREAKLTGEVNKGLVYVVKFLDYEQDRFKPVRKQRVKAHRMLTVKLP